MNDKRRTLAGGIALGAALGLSLAPGASAASSGLSHKSAAKIIHPRKGAGYAGVSSQKSGNLALPADLRVSPNAMIMNRFDIQWAATCMSTTGRGSYGGLSITLNKKITPQGSFTDNGSFTRMFSDGSKGLFTIKLFGQFTSPTRAAGTFRVTVAITDSTGASTDNCDSNVVNWIVTD